MERNNAQIRRLRIDTPNFRVEDSTDSTQLPALIGYAALFDVVTDLGFCTESVAPGAFTESIQRDDVRALFNHDPNYVLGRNTAGTLDLAEDDKGLLATIRPPDNSLGKDIVTLIKRKDVSQMSFGFYVEEEEGRFEENKKPHFLLKKVRLFDVSPVTFPAYEETEIDVKRAVRYRQDYIDARAEFEKRKREIKLLTLC